MFENVPKRLEAAIESLPKELHSEGTRYGVAAGFVIAEYLRQMPIGPAADPFFDFNQSSSGQTYEFTARVGLIGATLFELRSQPGFAEFCRRFRGRDFRSTFFELVAARNFLRGGFQLHARPEAGVLGEDFDFRAVRDEEAINVEVTALTAPEFSENTIRNALDKKRKQLPDNAPAIIFCTYPESWFHAASADQIEQGVELVANRFLGGTKRINAVVFQSEQHWDASGDGSLGAIFVTVHPVMHSSPRHPMSPLDYMGNSTGDSPRSIVQRNNIKEEAQLREGEFFRWVDWLLEIPPQK